MHSSLESVRQQLDLCLIKDRSELERQLRFIDQRLRSDKPVDKALKKLEEAMANSIETVVQRRAAAPTPTFSDELPVAERRDDIAAAIEQNQVVIVAGETGSGKTTQLPKICLSLGRGARGLIGCSQPRRVAARTIAARIAEELQSPLGAAVGYQVRFQDKVGADTVIKLMTDGILLAETQRDRDLLAYDTIIIDEAHERSLNIDFLLGYVKQLLPRRPDLKVLITSATIDTERFSRHFDDAPVISVAGRTYPVDVKYRAAVDEEDDVDLNQQVVAVVDEITRNDSRGDILVFLPGEREIRDLDETLTKQNYRHTEIVPLFARLSAEQQQKVFHPGSQRRIVLATNVAETSVTVPGIHYVIDPGSARISRYSHRSKVQLLPVEAIAQSSANQRKGRCGRIAAGVCYRLYSEADFLSRPEFTEPEILRSSLAGVILRMKSLGFGDIESFPFLDRPADKMIRDGQNLLAELGALDDAHGLTAVGRQMSHLPVDPRLSRMLIEANQQGSLSEVLILVAALSIQDPRERPMDAQQKADTAHAVFRDAQSDFAVLLNIWNAYREQKQALSGNQLQRWCRQNFLSAVRMREWDDLQRQLKQALGGSKQSGDKVFRFNANPAHYDAIHKALLSGLLGNIGLKSDQNEYLGARGIRFHIFPGSGLFKKKPKWIVAGELLETTRLFARNSASIEPEWVEAAAGDRLKTQCVEPHWQRKTARVMAYESGTVYGLPVYTRRLVDYGRHCPAEARELFIRAALVDGDWRTRAEFFEHNRNVLQSIVELEHKSRRQDVLVDEQVLFEFYDQRIGAEVVSGAQFEKWRQKVEVDNPKLLFFDREELMRHGAMSVTDQAFPTTLEIGGVDYPLAYRFEPGHAEDGVSVTIPVLALAQLQTDTLEWLVPGLLAEKVELMLKALPKDTRRAIFPIAETAQRCVDVIEPRADLLSRSVCQFLTDNFRARPQPSDLQQVVFPDHLRMTVRVVDGNGKLLASGCNLGALQRQFEQQVAEPAAGSVSLESYARHDIVKWDFGDLPEQQRVTVGNQTVMAYPSLVDAGRSVSLVLQMTPQKAASATRLGLNRLFQLQLPKDDKQLRKLPVFSPQVALRFRAIGSVEFLKDQFVFAVIDRVFLAEKAAIRSQQEFDSRLSEGKHQVTDTGRKLSDLLTEIIDEYDRVQRWLDGQLGKNAAVVEDVEQQLASLLPSDFLLNTSGDWLQHVPRYLKAISFRVEKCQRAAAKDAENRALVALHWRRYLEQKDSESVDRAALEMYRWMIEEYRVSLFAQQLKTAIPISSKRLDKQWDVVIRQIMSK